MQDGCSYWLHSYPAKKQRRARNIILLEEILAFIPRAWEVPHTQLKGVHQSVSGSAVDSCQECSSSLRCRQDHRKSCSACDRRNTDSEGSKWPPRTVVGPCDGMFVAMCGTCTTRCPMARESIRQNMWCNICPTFDPVRSQSQPQTHLLKRRVAAASAGLENAFRSLRGLRLTCGRRMVW